MASDAVCDSEPVNGRTLPAAEAERVRWAREVLVGLSILGADERGVLTLSYFDDLRHDAIAERLDLPPARVRTLAAGALIRLATFLETPRVLPDHRGRTGPQADGLPRPLQGLRPA